MKKILVVILLAMFALCCENKKVVHAEHTYYTCSMHPEVISQEPGKCPICGMPLTPANQTAIKESDDILELSDQQIQLGNIVVDTIRQSEIGNAIKLTGTLNINASRLTSLSARVMGRIEKLYVKTTGEYVAKGSPIYELYSEELNNAKQEYIAALERKSLFKEQSLINFDDLIANTRTKLDLWGMTNGQIKALETSKKAPLTTTFYSTEAGYVTSLDVAEGTYVMDGATIIQLADLSTLWAEAQVHTTQLYQIPKGATAAVLVSGSNKKINGRIEFVNPEASTDTRINLVRVSVPNAENQLRPGMPVLITIRNAERTGLCLPADAILRNANGAMVWLQTGKNKFRSQMITTGFESDGLTEVVSGLEEGDAVVIKGTYLLHSEFVFKRGTDPMVGHSH